MNVAEFHPPRRVLLGPGPSLVADRVLRAMSEPLVGHLDPVFLSCMNDVQELLRYVFETRNRLTIPLSGTGSAGMEAAMVNMVEPDEEVIIGIAGYFGERMYEIARRAGARPLRVETEWGRPLDAERIVATLEASRARVVFVVHAETSTGVLQPLEPLAAAIDKREGFLIVDAVTSLGAHSVGVDQHRLAVCYSGSQKALSCPPGLAPITVSDRALEKMRRRRTPVQSWYLDLSLVEKYWGSERTYHHTAPISMNYALREALRMIAEEGLEARWRRHELNARALWAGLEAMGLRLFVPESHRLWTLHTVCVPDGVDEARVRARLLAEFNIEIAGGLGPLKGKIWRIGLMGESSTRANVLLLLGALEHVLRSEGFRCGSGVEAASDVYAGADPST
ncbi:MAG TPA: alanine--glyoxylate aminotransferase family protein [Blastocatellia bacterium]|nr:alanine--glyoxylate aminotransferase family protein [Blastocatellia bacterium]